MEQLFRLLYIKRFFFLAVTLFAALLVAAIILYPNGRSFFIINGIHSTPSDWFFNYATHLGDGITAAVLCTALLVFYRFSAGISALLGFAFSGLLNSVLKNHVFVDAPRPKLFFWNNPMVHYVPDTYINIEHSFPSGHSNTAFFIFTFLVLLRWEREWVAQTICFLLACVAAYSRVYLAQHFVGDILGGMVIGICCAFIFYVVYRKLRTYKALDKNLVTMLKK